MTTKPVWDDKLGIWKDNILPNVNADELPSPLWIFGYGSLCWKTTFEYEMKSNAYIKGYIRRFWQKSTDHRGTPDSPGLVMTIVSQNDIKQNQLKYTNGNDIKYYNSDNQIHGIAYKLPANKVEQIVKHLDWREKGGYSRMITDIYLMDDNNEINKIKGLLYLGRMDNPHFCCCDINTTSQIIYKSIGPSGKNKDYLYELYKFFHKIGINDEYINELYNNVRHIEYTFSQSKL